MTTELQKQSTKCNTEILIYDTHFFCLMKCYCFLQGAQLVNKTLEMEMSHLVSNMANAS